MSIFVALSTFGGVNGAMLTTSRIFFVAGEEHQMPRIMAFLHIHKLTPLPAVVFTAFFSLLYLSVTDLYKLMNYLGFVQWFAISLSVLIVLIFRITRKEAIRPVRVRPYYSIPSNSLTRLIYIVSFLSTRQRQ